MPIDPDDTGRALPSERRRLAQLVQARDLMNAALLLLDDHSRSPAAATLDLAVHYLNIELAD